jgi:hypothetical protein
MVIHARTLHLLKHHCDIQQNFMCEWTTLDSSHMAHVAHTAMLVTICRASDGLALMRWQQYHAYVFDMEFVLYECFDFEQPGVYIAFFAMFFDMDLPSL